MHAEMRARLSPDLIFIPFYTHDQLKNIGTPVRELGWLDGYPEDGA